MTGTDDRARLRIDKWLWAARFYKTRSLAAEAVAGGKVHLNGARVKPARTVQPGDELRIHRGDEEFVVTVRAVASQRRPASEAQRLYQETEDSRRAREAAVTARRAEGVSLASGQGRPTKRDRRRLIRLVGDGG